MAAALVAGAGPLAGVFGQPDLAWPLRAIGIAGFGQGVMSFAGYLLAALGKVSSNLAVVFLESATEFTASAALVLLGTGATGAVFGRAAGYAFGALLGVGAIVRVLDRSVLRRSPPSRAVVRRLARYGGALAVVDGAWAAFGKVDPIVIASFMTPAAVGIFQAPMRFSVFLTYPGLALANSVAPRLAHAERRDDVVPRFLTALRLLVVVEIALVTPLLVWAEPVVSLILGSKYHPSIPVLRAVVPFVFLSGLLPLVSSAVDYLGDARRRIPVAIATVLVNVALDIVLVPRIGVLGAAVGTDVGLAVYAVGHFWIVRSALRLDLRPLVRTFLRAIAAAVAAGLLLMVVGTDDLSPGAWIVGMIIFPLAYVLGLIVTGELSARELGLARKALYRRVLRRAGDA